MEEPWTMYKDRPEWSDVIPVPQEDGPHPVVQIMYTKKFEDVYDYFRAIVASGELSERALELTKAAVELNPANYTVWQYRREILQHLKKDCREELKFIREVIEDNPKNYQVWHHRKVLVDWMQDPSSEMRFTEIMLGQDPKNYHAWQHRQWVTKSFKLYDSELKFTESMLQDDVRNNSAWNHRFFVVSNHEGFTDDVVKREVEFCKTSILKALNNDSPWNYLRGVLEQSEGGTLDYAGLETWLESLSKSKEGTKCPCLLAFLLDLWIDRMEQQPSVVSQHLSKALQICSNLSTEQDKIRKEYWDYMARKLKIKHGELVNGS